jgi:hypothetical protein
MSDVNLENLNEEDKKIWEVLSDFNIVDYIENGEVRSDIRVELFKVILKSIGKCSKCTAFIPDRSFCSVLKTSTGPNERCSDFEAVEIEDKSAFDIMTEDYQEAERIKATEPAILKYKRNKKKEFEIGGEIT